MKTQNRTTLAYCKLVGKEIPIPGKRKQAFLNTLCLRVDDFLLNHEEADLGAVEAEFGTPEDISAAFLEEMSYPEIIDKFRVWRRVMSTLAVALVIIFVALAGTIGHMLIKNSKNSIGNACIVVSDFDNNAGFDDTQP